MAENNSVGFVLPKATSMVRDYASTYVAIGNEFTKRYYQNREAYINNIINPLSKIQARKDDQPLLNDIKNGVTERANEFKESDRWHFAQDYIYDATQDILTNEGLKAIQNSYAAEQAYNEELKKSDWDARMQSAFKLRSLAQSSAIQYDKNTNTVTGGGFNGVHIGKKFDETAYLDKVFDMLSKAKADGYETSQLVTNAQALKQYGADVVFGTTGEEIVSHFVKLKQGKEEIREEDIYNYAYQMLSSNADYKSYLNTIFENENALNLYQEDPSNPNGFSFREYELRDLMPLFGDNTYLSALKGLGINIGDYGKLDKNGNFVKNKTLTREQAETLDLFELTYGINFDDVISGKVQIDDDLYQQGLMNYVDTIYNENGAVQGYDKQSWLKAKLGQNFINNHLHQFASSSAGLLSYTKVNSDFDFESNEAYKIWAKEWADGIKDPTTALPGNITLGHYETIGNSVNPDDWVNNSNKINEDIARIANLSTPTFSETELKALGITDNDPSELTTMDLDKISKNLQKNIDNPEERNAILAKARAYIDKFTTLNALQSKQGVYKQNIDKVFDIYNENPDEYNGWGWYGVADHLAKFILKNKIKSYDEYLNHKDRPKDYELIYAKNANEQYAKSVLGQQEYKEREVITNAEQFNKILSNALDNVINRYNKKDNQTFNIAVNSYEVFGATKPQQERLDADVAMWRAGSSGESAVSGLSLDGKTLDIKQISKIANLDNRYTSWTNGKSSSITQRNQPGKDTQFIDGKEFGIDGDIWYTEVRYVDDPNAYHLGRQAYTINCYGKDNTLLGKIPIYKENSSNQAKIDIMTRYGLLNTYNIHRGDKSTQQGLELSTYTNSFVNFNSSGKNNTSAFDNIYDLQRSLNMNGKVRTHIDISSPLNSQKDGNSRDVEITKHDGLNGQSYYTIKDLSNLNYKFGYDNIAVIENPEIANKKYNSVTEALNDFVKPVLDISYNVSRQLNY